MSNIICKILRSNIVLEPNVLFKNKVTFKSLAQTLRSVSYESNEEQKSNIRREENKAPLRFYSDKILAEKLDKMLKAEKKLKGVLKTNKKEVPSTKSFPKPDKDKQILNSNVNWLTRDNPTQTSSAAGGDDQKPNTQSKSGSKDMDHTENQTFEAEPRNVVSASRRKVPIRAINMASFLQAKIEHAFARGYTNYLTPARYHHINSTLAMREQKSGPLCEMLHEILMPINKELREKIAVPKLTSEKTKKIFNWNHPPPVSKFQLTLTPSYNKQWSEETTEFDEDSLPEPMRRWNEYYNSCAKEKTKLRCPFDVKDEKTREALQTERLNALLKLSNKRTTEDAEPLKVQFNPLNDVQCRYTHSVNLNYCNPSFYN